MGDIGALLATGVPPTGRGLFARGDSIISGPWDFVSIVSGARWRELAAMAQARGLPHWFFLGPSSWRPESWRDTVPTIVARARATGAQGIIADVENGWPDLDNDTRTRELTALGRKLADVSSETRVMVTSYPGLPGLTTLARACGDRVVGNVQIYGRGSRDAAVFQRWYDRWSAAFGPRLTVSVAGEGWSSVEPTNLWLNEPGAFPRYLASIPRSAGGLVWYEGSDIPAEHKRALASWNPGGDTPLGGAALAAAAFLTGPVGIALLVLALVLVAAYFATR